MDATVIAADGWEPILAAALLGAERAPPAPPGPLADLITEPDPGAALLARLAAEGLHHLAGLDLAPDAMAPLAPREAAGRDCPPAAAMRLYGLLGGGHAARERLREWFDLAAAARMRPPAWLHQALMLQGRTLPETARAVVGPELAWLAGACGEAPEDESDEAPDDWTVGSLAERRAAFAAFRARDPDGARAALEPVFRKEKADMREALVGALATGLSPADEPFLEACLDDRAGGVREAAQRLLPLLPGSLYASRMAMRAATALVIETKTRLLRSATHDLVVTLPEDSPTLARDGVTPNQWEQRGGGIRAGLLRDILARTPLRAFAGHPPRLWLELALRGEWSEPILKGLFETIARERDPDWTRAAIGLLAEAYEGKVAGVRRTNELIGRWVRAVDLLPDAEWEAAVTELIRARKIEVVLAMIGSGPESFSERFSAALIDWLAFVLRGSDDLRRDLAKPWVIGRLGERLWPGDEVAASAAALAARLPEQEGDRLRPQVTALSETLDLRVAMRREFETPTEETARG
ncbi:hypothetical protein NS228_09645 [Methylobacterium indicum]|uniref:DUF5691 domain-containing protein n=1 Tax=Methylobacterium indicum TaxID=1775910 RepID=UPI000734D298|nr:DUF5691 domain-containing protein [Methylobacterium indicum]KTS20193.1 hypothetical protein NS229_24595 [Methylobacterium indicum]KTS40735.1 hypothetical protein NS228_09645 [Methylobacterium indicum]KTS52221.1 hypothetical protein NS230_10910 [Methylobacterium indicum]